MRDELADAVKQLFAGRNPSPPQLKESDPEFWDIDKAVSLMVRLRVPSIAIRHTREIEAVLGTEGTARPGLVLIGIFTGLQSLGVESRSPAGVSPAGWGRATMRLMASSFARPVCARRSRCRPRLAPPPISSPSSCRRFSPIL
jgi:hypothetical protein